MFVLGFAAGWDDFFSKIDKSEREVLWKKILKLEQPIKARHLKFGVPIFVVESGQNRICFREKGNRREVLFAGNHKQYDKWCKSQEQDLR